MDLVKALRAVEGVEQRLAALYRKYELWFADDAEAASLFRQMAREEKGHCSMIRFQLSMATKNRGQFNEVELNLEPIEEMTAVLNQIVAAEQPPTLAEALVLAIELEREEAAGTYRTSLLGRANPDLAALVKSLRNVGQEDGRHLSDLENFARLRGIVIKPAPPAGPTVRPAAPASAD